MRSKPFRRAPLLAASLMVLAGCAGLIGLQEPHRDDASDAGEAGADARVLDATPGLDAPPTTTEAAAPTTQLGALIDHAWMGDGGLSVGQVSQFDIVDAGLAFVTNQAADLQLYVVGDARSIEPRPFYPDFPGGGADASTATALSVLSATDVVIAGSNASSNVRWVQRFQLLDLSGLSAVQGTYGATDSANASDVAAAAGGVNGLAAAVVDVGGDVIAFDSAGKTAAGAGSVFDMVSVPGAAGADQDLVLTQTSGGVGYAVIQLGSSQVSQVSTFHPQQTTGAIVHGASPLVVFTADDAGAVSPQVATDIGFTARAPSATIASLDLRSASARPDGGAALVGCNDVDGVRHPVILFFGADLTLDTRFNAGAGYVVATDAAGYCATEVRSDAAGKAVVLLQPVTNPGAPYFVRIDY